MPEFPSGTVAFLFTDIEGSTRRWERDAAAMWSAVERHFAILDEAIQSNDGVRYKTVGDAVQAAFPTAHDAVAAALAGQLALIAEPWGALDPLRVRMAIHVGAAEPRDGDYLAPSLNRLARLLSAGYGGQVLLTRAAADLTRSALPAGAALRGLGEHRLRDLHHAETVFQLLHPALPSDFAPLKTLDVQRHNLPPQATPFIGRTEEIASVVELLQRPEVRLVTITGPGGMGKTRLGLRVAEEVMATFPDGVWFVDLAPLHDPALVQQAIARAIGLHEESGRSLHEVLTEYIASRALLFVLDNFEQLLDAAPIVSDLLSASPGAKALVTSRAPLRLRGEREVNLPPLRLPDVRDVPAPLEEISQSEAIQLFVERAEAVQPSFALTAETAPTVIEICRRLDGLPLAIELAAARVRVLPPGELLARLDDRLRVLTGGPRDAPARQQTLRQTIAWSYDLLSPKEQSLFRRLAVFADHPTLAAIEAVIDPDGILDVFDDLASLVEKSLVQQEEGRENDPRFWMLQTIRAYGLEQLAAQDEDIATRSAHAHYFMETADRAQSHLFGPEQGAWCNRFEADHDDFREALYWLLDRHDIDGALRLVNTLWRFWSIRGYLSEGTALLAQVLSTDASANPVARSCALVGSGMLTGAQGDYDRAATLLEEAFTLAREGSDDRATALALAALAVNAEDQGDFAQASRQHEEALALYRKVGDQVGIAQELIGLGTHAASVGNSNQAATLLEEAATLSQTLGDMSVLGLAKLNLGRLAFLDGDIVRAVACSNEALAIFRDLEDDANVALLLANLGDVAQLQGEVERAATLYDEALTLSRELGDKRNIAATLMAMAEIEVARGTSQQAMTLLHESLTLAREVDDREGIARGLEAFAAVATATGATDKAVRALGTAEALREAIGAALPAVYRLGQERLLGTARASLNPEEFEQVWASGRSLSVEDAMAAAQDLVRELQAQPASQHAPR